MTDRISESLLRTVAAIAAVAPEPPDLHEAVAQGGSPERSWRPVLVVVAAFAATVLAVGSVVLWMGDGGIEPPGGPSEAIPDRQFDLIVWADQGLGSEALSDLAAQIMSLDGVESAQPWGAAMTFDEFRSLFADSPELLDVTDPGVLPASVRVWVETPEAVPDVVAWAESEGLAAQPLPGRLWIAGRGYRVGPLVEGPDEVYESVAHQSSIFDTSSLGPEAAIAFGSPSLISGTEIPAPSIWLGVVGLDPVVLHEGPGPPDGQGTAVCIRIGDAGMCSDPTTAWGFASGAGRFTIWAGVPSSASVVAFVGESGPLGWQAPRSGVAMARDLPVTGMVAYDSEGIEVARVLVLGEDGSVATTPVDSSDPLDGVPGLDPIRGYGDFSGAAYPDVDWTLVTSLVVRCANDQGMDVHVLPSGDGIGFGGVPPDQHPMATAVLGACREGLDLPPYEPPTPQDLAGHYVLLLELAECIEAQGFDVAEPPSLASYLDSGGSWHPYGSLTSLDGVQMTLLGFACPQVVPAQVVVEGTRSPYTSDETQAYGEIGPLLWGLVTTVGGIEDISHGPGYEWVTWGPLWGGRLSVPGPFDAFGVTDLSAVDVDAVAAVVPEGQSVLLREVRWSLDELEEFKELLNEGAPDNGVCSTGFGSYVNRIRAVATEPFDLGDVPIDAVAVETVEQCPEYIPAGGPAP